MKIGFALAVMCIFSGCQETPGVDFIGLDEQKTLSMPQYESQLREVMTAVQDSALPALQENRSDSAPGANWNLHTVVVGIGLKMDFDTGAIGIGANPGMRFAFSNSSKPSIP